MGGVVITPFPHAFRYGWDEETATGSRSASSTTSSRRSPPDDTAAVIVEPVLGEGGYVPANAEFLRGLRERADRHGFLLILDEVQTGVGRTGRFWGHDHFGVRPDILVTAKGLASGFPLSGIAASEELMAKAWPGSQGGTYGGNAVACAAAVATLEVVREEKPRAERRGHGRAAARRPRGLAAKTPAIGDVRGLGLMLGSRVRHRGRFARPGDRARVQRAAARRGCCSCSAALEQRGPDDPRPGRGRAAIDAGLRAWTAAVRAGTGSA